LVMIRDKALQGCGGKSGPCFARRARAGLRQRTLALQKRRVACGCDNVMFAA
jgi:hypothetical protein